MYRDIRSICQQCALILHGKAQEENGFCSITIKRPIQAKIQGRTTHAAIHSGVTFESMDSQGLALNLGEFVILQEELQPFTSVLLRHGLVVSAIHNHWIFSEPFLLYVHFQSVEPPISFAQKTADALAHIQ